MNFGRILTAMVTPFNDVGEIDFDKTSKLIEHLIATGTEALVISGTTGESPTLTTSEKLSLFKYVVKIVNKRIPVIASTGCNNTRASVQLTKQSELCGVDGFMLVTPFYNKPNQQGMYDHFSTIAKATKLPIMLYNIPSRSSINLSVETVIQLSEINNIVAIKESSGDLEAAAEIVERTNKNFVLYSGDDSMFLPTLSIGGEGIVSVASHIIGKEMQKINDCFMSGQVERAAAIHREYLPLMQGLFTSPSPAPIKTALKMIGIDVGSVRLPLIKLTKDQKEILANLLSTLEK